MKKVYTFAALSMMLVFSISITAQDTESDFIKVSERKDWGFSISPYAWLAGQSADVGGEKLRQSFNDLSSLTNFGFQLAAQARYKRFILSFDGTYAILGADGGSDLLDVEFSLDQWIIDTKLGYLFYDDIHYKEDEVIAGFGIGNASNLSWDINYYNTFRITKLINVTAGYRSFNFNRVDGEGEDALETRVRVYGPLLGVSFVL